MGRTKPLAIALALWCCHQVLSQNYVVINAVDFYGKEAFFFTTPSSPKRLFRLALYNRTF
jgi:hypothetical protein